jgi:hypothetical protein
MSAEHPLPAGRWPAPAPGQASTVAACAILRAAAGLIESSGADTRLYVTCTDRAVKITVREPHADTAARITQAARIARRIGGTLRQADHAEVAASDMTASGLYRGIPVQVATLLLVRHSGTHPGSLPLARTPDGEVTALRGRLPEDWRWVTELDPRPERTAAVAARPGRPRRAPGEFSPLTSTILLAAVTARPTGPAPRPGATPGRRPARQAR